MAPFGVRLRLELKGKAESMLVVGGDEVRKRREAVLCCCALTGAF
jgi:hypothetical protein